MTVYVTAFPVYCVGVDDRLASIAGYADPSNQIFAFQSRAHARADALRFVALHIFNVVVTAN